MSTIGDVFADTWRSVVHGALRLAPVERASDAGAMLASVVVRASRRSVLRAARANLRFHRPHASEAELTRAVDAFLDNIGRVMAEFSVIDRIAAEGRITLVAPESARALPGRKPVVCLMLHIGNWEMFGPALRQAQWEVSAIYTPPTNAAERRIAEEVRKRMGFELLKPDRAGIRGAIERLGQNGIISIFVDEARAGKTVAPLFGRPPHARGNLSVAARLARRTGAQLVIGYCERVGKCRFQLRVSEPFTLPDHHQGRLEDVAFLNDRIEPIILDHLDQWYFLDDEISAIDSDARAHAP